MALILLHGTLHVTIVQAADLVDEERTTGAAPRFFRKMVEEFEEVVGFGEGASLLYATVDLAEARVGRTRLIKHEPVNPIWNETFHIHCAHNVADVTISVKDDHAIGAALIGRAKIPVHEILGGKAIEGWYDLYHDNGEKLKGDSRILVRLEYHDVEKEHDWGTGLRDGNRFEGVPFTYYKKHKGCKVTLYQDSHMLDEFLPPIYLEGGALRQPTRCWEDVFEAINGANHLIYITGWSVYTSITLVRDPERQIEGSTGVTLGELLKRKADEGVRVLMLVWDDRTSIPVIKKDGLMATHDQETLDYFEDTNVNCYLCPRNADDSLSFIQGFQIGAMFTHHQKTIIVDAAVPGGEEYNERRLVSFVGGIDLCDGRYDNQSHSLFRTLDTLHKDDFHQPNFEESSIKKGGPREPWHDIHSKLEGPAAWDVLHNFEQRWLLQAPHKELLLPIDQISNIVPPTEITAEDDPNTWHVQVFRSIDAGAAAGFPEDPELAAASGLVSGKDNTVDRSIQDAYIRAIRRAKNFIYIENQYFLGSSFSWEENKDTDALHLIPRELALKIVSKIEAGERFTVYIVVPMWPEGIPESGQVLAILDWMKRTMQMMYKAVAQALEAKQIDYETVKDYLCFFCLGNRETRQGGEYLPPESPEEGTNYKSAQDNRRFMIYVHAKMMIVDDEYIIIGSANINQRSMDGARDTEIAMGAYQPYHIATDQSPRGEIHGFRMSLWYEHLGLLDNVFLKPWSLECVRKVNTVSDNLWNLFAADSPVDLPGHLLTYPVAISSDGSVLEFPGLTHFPDTKANILGVKSELLPPILTS
ncbi:hypothetical protein O6H91_02G045900 [Diphasiastrum complanatum]|uniref:Uncharacterized protein n=6 Tax=Diphasiastrum complanatum TaxID=34168 RepID=A0ACC2EFB3_DIPCM|nr:hypothetical protein O6H91_02G045900 [Diphasiastrum complanatum]KAJ7565056.1 hypothetical protein O6H91_02G045900 [Diphasiastrum complanatum]KAJ7565057.1 hypothetical protein O6H91_02G045900 [Diphasiastrum complanatum]KAJ7565058.1 hypothetical protein O6H91_02G045900 [Diphasiastrum complanatum]KAJ7565059.1 hypothetical protein O6H91_02G045900 [Diphasiastrum complanatum]